MNGHGLQAGTLPDKLVVASAKSDKKPFTYLPGGMNLSEIKSPRMARRLAKHQANIVQVKSFVKKLQGHTTDSKGASF
jgi:hypothetical protein